MTNRSDDEIAPAVINSRGFGNRVEREGQHALHFVDQDSQELVPAPNENDDLIVCVNRWRRIESPQIHYSHRPRIR